ncbi:MAG: molybdopterin molybdotransferase MoeA [Methanocella sp.]|jgi:molybdopterin biosynthesis enzyme
MSRLLTYEEAKHAIDANLKPASLGYEEAVLLEAYNRVLAADVVSPLDIPGVNSARVAGYAVRSVDTAGAGEDNPVCFKVAGTIAVGEVLGHQLGVGESFEVTSGAMLPEGADAVIALEDIVREDDTLQVYSPASEGENVCLRGSDVKLGTVVFERNQVLGATEIGVLAGLGLKQVPVLKLPMVAVLTVSNEVSELSKPLERGRWFDVNGYSLSTAIMECGAKPVYFGVVPEDRAEISRMVSAAVADSDMVIVCSDNPLVTEVIGSLPNSAIIVNGVAIRPGKSTAAATVEGKPVFVFPSNPTAVLIMYQLFARGQVQRLAGRPVAGLRALSAVAGSKLFSAKGSRTFMPVKLSFDEQCRLIVDSSEVQGAVSGLADVDGFVEIPENEQFLEVDQAVVVWLLRGIATKA